MYLSVQTENTVLIVYLTSLFSSPEVVKYIIASYKPYTIKKIAPQACVAGNVLLLLLLLLFILRYYSLFEDYLVQIKA